MEVQRVSLAEQPGAVETDLLCAATRGVRYGLPANRLDLRASGGCRREQVLLLQGARAQPRRAESNGPVRRCEEFIGPREEDLSSTVVRPDVATRWTVRLIAAALVVGSTACGASDSGRSRGEPGADCQAQLANRGSLETRHAGMSGDMDGDGQPDNVKLVFEPKAPVRCQHLLVLEGSRTGRLLSSVYEGGLDDPWPTPGVPRLIGFANIDRSAGAEALVKVRQGAATAFVAVYTVRGPRLQRVWIPTQGGRWGAFSYGGSVGLPNGVDCAGGAASGRVAQYTAVRLRTAAILRKRLFEARGTSFALLHKKTARVRRLPSAFDRAPFASCAIGRVLGS